MTVPVLDTYLSFSLKVPVFEIGAGFARFCGGGGPPPWQKIGGWGTFIFTTSFPLELTLKLMARPPFTLIVPLYLAPLTGFAAMATVAVASMATTARRLTRHVRERHRPEGFITSTSLLQGSALSRCANLARMNRSHRSAGRPWRATIIGSSP